MFTLPLSVVGVHHMTVSFATPQADRGSPVVVLALVALVLSVAALGQLRHAMAPIGEFIRALVSALAVAVMLFGLFGVLVWLLVIITVRN